MNLRRFFYFALAVPVLLEIFWFHNPHPHFWWHHIPGANAALGAGVCALFIFGSKFLNKLLGRPVDYYEEGRDGS